MEKKQVFISYKSEEINEALWVKDNLEAQGITCWMAPMSVTGGASFATEIAEAIDHCSIFVLLLSAKAQQSPIITKELHRAVSKKKVIMPFLLENCPLKGDFEFLLCDIHYYNGYKDKADAIRKMLREIRLRLGIQESSPIEEPKPVVPAPAQQEPKPPKSQAVNTKARKSQAVKSKAANKSLSEMIVQMSIIVCIAVVAIGILIIVIEATRKVTFADTTFYKSDYSIQVTDQTITVEDMKKLSKFKQLHRITLTGCTISAPNLGAISNHTLYELSLEDCNLSNSQLQSISFDKLDTLTTLKLSANKELSNLSALIPLADTLTTLSISNTDVKDLAPLQSFTRLTTLSAENLGLSTLEPLSMAVYLETLIVDGNELTDLTGLENTTILKEVSLKDNHLQAVDALSNSSNTLKKLYLDGNSLTDLSCLSDCTNIVAFSAERNLLSSMDWAYGWSKLVRLSVADNQIQSIEYPPQSINLNFLDLSNNQLSQFSNFVFTSYGVTLNLSSNQITSVSLPGNCTYNFLALHGNPIKELIFAEGFRAWNASIDYFDGMDANIVKAFGASDLYIIDCPPKHIIEMEQADYSVTLLKRSQIHETMPDPEFPQY